MEAQDYKKLVEALRCTMKHEKVICAITECSYNKGKRCKALPYNKLFHDAADAIEFLIKDRDFWKDAAVKAKEES